MGLAKLLPLISPNKRLEEDMHRLIRKLVCTYSRGSAHLSLGRYITSAQAERIKKRVQNYHFI